ncbi:MAG TPA: prolyl oligopeptidase family serine peptidase [Steroidobacteraceae bacterium]|jgi:prolyl oligopeptidase
MYTIKSLLLVAAGAFTTFGQCNAAAESETKDPFLWLEDVHGNRAMQWVADENAKTLKVLEADAHFGPLFEDAKQLAEAKDRIPVPQFIGGRVYNLWQDADHPHGIWRQTTLSDYQSDEPNWQVVIDLDALSSAEHANWFGRGVTCEEPEEKRCLIELSDGGEDAETIREFDLPSGTFVKGGFDLPTGKQRAAWEDPDTLLISRIWVKGEQSKSGYPIVVKRLKRGQPLDSAVEVFRGKTDDFLVEPVRLDDGLGHHAVLIERGVEFFRFERYLVQGQDMVKLTMPQKSEVIGLVEGRMVVSINEPWQRGAVTLPAGSLVSFDLANAEKDPEHINPGLIYAPGPREALEEASATHGHLLVHTLDNVRGRAASYTPLAGDKWTHKPLPLPDNISVNIVDTDIHSDRAFVRTNEFLTPQQLELFDLTTGVGKTVKSLPPKFDASRDVVEQFEAISKDGTHVPYFIVHPKDMKMDGSTPTILEAYGGFQSSITPRYDPALGKLWLERGGAYVLANIRGGGEFGPKWHEAGLKTHRQRIYDDFAAVGADLVSRHFTSVAHLGIRGGSNGGLLMGVEFTQHPEMWSAVDIQVPLLDMLRYEQIAAGSSWVGEYGSVTDPEERRFLASISPYNNLKADVHYPQPLIWTTTKDDRVGPQHARKFAAKLAAMKIPYLFYEVVEGGHGSGATPEEHAHTQALEYTYFWSKLSDAKP